MALRATAARGRYAPPMERTRGRQQRGLVTDDRILDAAVATVAAQGADHVGLRDVAAAAGLTYGALYARYANVAELLADLWERRLAAELRNLAEAAATFRPAADDAPERLAALLATTPARRSLVDLLSVTARVDDLADVVPPSAASILRGAGLLPDAAAPGSAPDVVGLGILGLALGSVAQAPIDGGRAGDAEAIVTWLRAGAGRRRPEPLPELPATAEPRLPAIPDLRRARLLEATLRVIARSGVQGATLRRISRASGYAHTAVYQEYGSLHALIADLVEVVARAARVPDRTPGRYTDAAAGAARVVALLSPAGRTRRRLLVEFALAAAHDPDLAGRTAAADDEAYRAIAALLAPGDPERQAPIALFRAVARELQLGLALLEETAGGLDGIDWRPAYGTLKAGALAAAGVAEGA